MVRNNWPGILVLRSLHRSCIPCIPMKEKLLKIPDPLWDRIEKSRGWMNSTRWIVAVLEAAADGVPLPYGKHPAAPAKPSDIEGDAPLPVDAPVCPIEIALRDGKVAMETWLYDRKNNVQPRQRALAMMVAGQADYMHGITPAETERLAQWQAKQAEESRLKREAASKPKPAPDDDWS